MIITLFHNAVNTLENFSSEFDIILPLFFAPKSFSLKKQLSTIQPFCSLLSLPFLRGTMQSVLPYVQEKMAGKSVKKCIVIPSRLVNLIVG